MSQLWKHLVVRRREERDALTERETTEIYLNIRPEDALSEFFQTIGDTRRRRWD